MVIDLNKIKKEQESRVLSEVCIYADRSGHYGKLSIHLDFQLTERNFDKDPYIKICDNPSWDKSKSAARVHLRDMWVDYSHNDIDGKHRNPLPISRKIASDLDSIYGLVISVLDNKPVTVFDAIKLSLLERYPNMVPIEKISFTKCFTDKNKREI